MIDDVGSHCALLDWGSLLKDLTVLMFLSTTEILQAILALFN